MKAFPVVLPLLLYVVVRSTVATPDKRIAKSVGDVKSSEELAPIQNSNEGPKVESNSVERKNINSEEKKKQKGPNVKTPRRQSSGVLNKLRGLAMLSLAVSAGASSSMDNNLLAPKMADNQLKELNYAIPSPNLKPIYGTTFGGPKKNGDKSAHQKKSFHAVARFTQPVKPPKLINFDDLFRTHFAKTEGNKVATLKGQWPRYMGPKASFEDVFVTYNATNDQEKISLMMELLQRAAGTKFEYDQKLKLADMPTVQKIDSTYFSVEKNAKKKQKYWSQNYRGSSESMGKAVLIKEMILDHYKDDKVLLDQLEIEPKVLKILEDNGAKHAIQMYKRELKGYQQNIVMEFGWINILDFWNQKKHVGDSVSLLHKLLDDMLQALEEFHNYGVHMEIRPYSFIFVEDPENGWLELKEGGQTYKVRTKLMHFEKTSLLNPTKWDPDVPKAQRDKIKVDKNAYVYREESWGYIDFMAPEEFLDIEDSKNPAKIKWKVSTKTDIWSLGITLYAMLSANGNTPMEAVCDSSGQFVIRKDTDGRKVNDCLWAFMDDPGATASKTPYPSIDEMDAQGTRSFWYAAQSAIQTNPKVRPTTTGLRAYLRGECRIWVGEHLVGMDELVPRKVCQMQYE